jgi:hypothetical protein
MKLQLLQYWSVKHCKMEWFLWFTFVVQYTMLVIHRLKFFSEKELLDCFHDWTEKRLSPQKSEQFMKKSEIVEIFLNCKEISLPIESTDLSGFLLVNHRQIIENEKIIESLQTYPIILNKVFSSVSNNKEEFNSGSESFSIFKIVLHKFNVNLNYISVHETVSLFKCIVLINWASFYFLEFCFSDN